MKLHLPLRLRRALLSIITAVAFTAMIGFADESADDHQTAEFNAVAAMFLSSPSVSGDNSASDNSAEATIVIPAEAVSLDETNATEGVTTEDSPATDSTPTLSLTSTSDSVSDTPLMATVTPVTLDASEAAFSSSTASLSSSSGLMLSGTTTYTNGTYSRTGQTEHLTDIQNFQSYESILFEENQVASSSANAYGGAIYASSSLTFSDNGDITFSGNTASGSSKVYGGAIYGRTQTFTGNGDITFSENTSTNEGGATYATTLSFSDNGNIVFNENASYGEGGAIYASSLTFSDNSDITFSGNTAIGEGACIALGGAIFAVSLELVGNGNITFCKNTAKYEGGAIFAAALTFSGNDDILFKENETSGNGGAIYIDSCSSMSFSGNGYITFSGNMAYGIGGAVYTTGDIYFWGGAMFERNAESLAEGVEPTYRLRSICQENTQSSLELSAPTDESIEFRDSIYSCASTVIFNRNDTKFDSGTQESDGTIRFTGKYTAADLAEVKGSEGTAEEIKNSLTSEITGTIQLMGGTLSVEDGAILKIGSLVANEKSATLSIRDASLFSTSSITLGKGSTLEIGGQSTMSVSNVSCDNFRASIDVSSLQQNDPIVQIYGWLLANRIDVDLQGSLPTEEGIYLLMEAGMGKELESIEEKVIYSGSVDTSQLKWEKFGLVYYNGKQSNGSYEYSAESAPLAEPESWYCYKEGLIFKNNTAGAISTSRSLSFAGNSDILFCENSNSDGPGGAICSTSDSWISFSGNNDITFSRNHAEGDGGAIEMINPDNPSLIFSDNGNITFCANHATRNGGAIATTLKGESQYSLSFLCNKNITFSQNSAYFGGAIDSFNVILTFKDNNDVDFIGNSATGAGAIYCSGFLLSFTDNENINFIGNGGSTDDLCAWSCGGAIMASGTLNLCNNNNIIFSALFQILC